MRITIIYRYFWPDTPPYAFMLKEIAGWLSEAGHEVEIITAQPSYKSGFAVEKQPERETLNGAKIIRLHLLSENGSQVKKLINSGLFLVQAMWRIIFGRKTDLVWTATMPPVFQALGVMLAGRLRGAGFLYHMQDIYPEIGVVSGDFKKGLVSKSLTAIDNFTHRRTTKAVVLSEDMQSAIAARGLETEHIAIMQNFTLVQSVEQQASAPSQNEPVRFVFAGNIGRFQNLEALVDTFSKLSEENVELHLVGEGRVKSQLQKQVVDNDASNIHFHDHMPVDKAFEFLCTCHVGVVSLVPDLYKYAFPSKVLTYMAANLPMLALVENNSALAKLLSFENIGVSAAWSSEEAGLAEAVRDCAVLARSGKTNPAQSKHIYHQDAARKNWIDLLASIEQERGLA